MVEKRKKKYYNSGAAAKKQRTQRDNAGLRPGLKGFLISCNMREAQAVREAYNLFGEYAEELYGPEFVRQKTRDKNADASASVSDPSQSTAKREEGASSEEGSDDDLEAAVLQECEFLRQNGSNEPEESQGETDAQIVPKIERRFSAVDTNVKNILFIKTTIADDSCSFVHRIFSDLKQKQEKKFRFMLRVMPVQLTCKAYVKDVQDAVHELLDQMKDEIKDGDAFTYALQCKIRNNSSVKRDPLISDVCDVIRGRFPASKVHLNDPQWTFLVEVLNTVCCLAIVKDFVAFKKYNIQELVGYSETKTDARTAAKMEQQTADKSEKPSQSMTPPTENDVAIEQTGN